MAIDTQTVTKVAKLARIRLMEEEKPQFAGELNHILKWVEQLSEVDTENVAPLASVSAVTLPWREDKVTDGGKQAEVLKNAPKSAHGCFAVPKVIE